jgi:ribonuclease I
VYFQKTREVMSAVRVPVDDTLRADSKLALNLQANLIREMLNKQNKANVAIKPSDLG